MTNASNPPEPNEVTGSVAAVASCWMPVTYDEMSDGEDSEQPVGAEEPPGAVPPVVDAATAT